MYDIGKLTEIARLCSAIKAIMPAECIAITINNEMSPSIQMYNAQHFRETFRDYDVKDMSDWDRLSTKIGDVEVMTVDMKNLPLP